MKILLSVLLFVGCVDQAPSAAISECGEVPPYPGAAVAFEQINGADKAILDRAAWILLDTWHQDVSAWASCVENL